MVSKKDIEKQIKSKKSEIKRIDKSTRIPRVTLKKQIELKGEFGDASMGAKQFRKISKVKRREGLGRISVLNQDINRLTQEANLITGESQVVPVSTGLI